MASRMERYYNSEERSKKNRSLYDQISNLENYTNIEGVVDISNSNEININTVKKLIGKEEQKVKQSSKEEFSSTSSNSVYEEKNYDLKDVLQRAKHGHSDKDIKHRKLKIHQYEILKKLKEEQPNNEKIDELLNTMALSDTNGDDLGIFDELKSNTMIGNEASAIKNVLDEAKGEVDDEEIIVDDEMDSDTTPMNNLDNSFYTSSFNFSDKDFDDLKNLDDTLKKNNKLIRILIILFSVTIAIIILIVIAKFIVF